MRIGLLLLMAIFVIKLSFSSPNKSENATVSKQQPPNLLSTLVPSLSSYHAPTSPLISFEAFQKMLLQAGLDQNVIDKVFKTLKCSAYYHQDINPILTVINYALPSNEKRLWVFDLQKKHLLFHTYVSHGLNSGKLYSQYFSNKYDSKTSSIGVFKTENAYYGKEGLSLRLEGLDRGFNENALRRYIVMHGGWYVSDDFIKKYGRVGRSWGCPALPLDLHANVIHTIQGKSLLLVYYPRKDWLSSSQYLHCEKPALQLPPFKAQTGPRSKLSQTEDPKAFEYQRDEILYVDVNNNGAREESEPIVTLSASHYIDFFQKRPPLSRMLRRPIAEEEYIALNDKEFRALIQSKSCLIKNQFIQSNQENPAGQSSVIKQDNPCFLEKIHFVIPVLTKRGGYTITLMKIIPLGQVRSVNLTNATEDTSTQKIDYRLQLNNQKEVHVKASKYFIRWIGL